MTQKILRVEKFLQNMEQVVPWKRLCDQIKPYYSDNQNGRPAHDLLLMLKIHCLQLWHNLSDPEMEEAIYDRMSFQRFLGFDCFGGRVPDESSILRFRHLLEKNNLANSLLKEINAYLDEKGLVLKRGTIVDATLMQSMVSKKNKDKARDPEMTSTKKNNKYYFGAKGHIGVQAEGKPIIHRTHYSTAKDSDKKHMRKLFHGEETIFIGDSGYTDQEEKRGSRALGYTYGIADRGARKRSLSNKRKKRNQKWSGIRAKVEHPFRIMKEVWGHRKLRYKGLEKNGSQFTMLCALSNIYFCRKEPCFH